MNAFRAAGVAALILAVPLTARAQTCLGVPSSAGQLAVAGQVGFTEGYTLYGGEVSMHAPSNITLAARFLVAAPEEDGDNVTTFGGTIAYSLVHTGSIAICPMVGLEYRSWDLPTAVTTPVLGTEDEFTELMIPVGVGAGVTLATGPLNATVYAVPQFIWVRTSYTTPETSADDSDSAFGGQAGITLSRGSFFGGASVFTTTFDDYDPRFIFQLGFLLGGRD